MNRKKTLVAIFTVLFSILILGPVNATQPQVIDDIWFVTSLSEVISIGKILELNEILVVKDEVIAWDLYRSPPGSPGTVQIGTATTTVNLQFNSNTGKGNALIQISLTFTEVDTAKNPYGIGTLDGILYAELTSMHPTWDVVPGDGTGFIVATQGTGAFENAKLTADVVLSPFQWPPAPAPPVIWLMGFFFGTHPTCNGEGTIIYH